MFPGLPRRRKQGLFDGPTGLDSVWQKSLFFVLLYLCFNVLPIAALDLRPTVSPWLEDGVNIYLRVQRNVAIGTAIPVDALSLTTAPVASATRALVNLSNTALSGGSVAGTYVGANPTACTGDFLNFQLADAARTKLSCAGALTVVSSTNNLSIFAATTSAQLAGVISDETGTGLAVFNASPTLTNPVIANITPGANFTLTQNSVVPFTSVNAGAVANTLVLTGGKVAIGFAAPDYLLSLNADNIHIGLYRSSMVKMIIGIANANDSLILGSVAGDIIFRAQTQKILMSTDSGATSALTIATNNGITIAGTFKSTAINDLGWIIQNAANQACNTTCTTGACVMGFDTAALGNFLACTDATADTCLCAG